MMISIPSIRTMSREMSNEYRLERCRMEEFSHHMTCDFERSQVGSYTIMALLFHNGREFQLNLHDRQGRLKAILRDDFIELGALDAEGANLVNRLAQVFYRI